MVDYSRQWLKETNEVPIPDNLLEMYWPVPRVIDMSTEAVMRRTKILDRIGAWWAEAVKRLNPKPFDGKEPEVEDLYSEDRQRHEGKSYRIILALMQIESLVEDYAQAYRKFTTLPPEGVPALEAEFGEYIKIALTEAFEAHKPIEQVTTITGPNDTLDPDYIKYRWLCKKYNIQPGQLLHKALQP
jgi:hypothetical protein